MSDEQHTQFYRITNAVGPLSDPPSAAKLRALTTRMAVEPQDNGEFQVSTPDSDAVTVTLSPPSCTCTAGQKLDNYVCQHIHHVKERADNNTLAVADDWVDPVVETEQQYAEEVAAAKEREANTQRAGDVVAEPGEVLVECVVCGDYAAYERDEQYDYRVYMCAGCPPQSDIFVGVADSVAGFAEPIGVPTSAPDEVNDYISVAPLARLSDGCAVVLSESVAVAIEDLRNISIPRNTV